MGTREPRYSASLFSPYWQMLSLARQLPPLWADEAIPRLCPQPPLTPGPQLPHSSHQVPPQADRGERREGAGNGACHPSGPPKSTEEMFKGGHGILEAATEQPLLLAPPPRRMDGHTHTHTHTPRNHQSSVDSRRPKEAAFQSLCTSEGGGKCNRAESRLLLALIPAPRPRLR